MPGAGDAVDFAGATVNASVTADIDAAFGAVTMGSGVITFSGSLTASSFSDTSKIAVGANSTVTLDGDLVLASSVVYSVASGGKFVVTGVLTPCSWAFPQVAPGDGTIVVGGIVDTADGTIIASHETHAQKWAIGPQGITGTAGTRLWVYSNAGAAPEFRPWTNDFTISVGSVVRTNARSFTINTTGLDGAGHTITLDAGFADNGDPLNVTGTGKVVVNHVTAVIGDKSAYSGAVEVKDSATLAINAGKTLTSGAMTVESGAALEVAESGEVALGGGLELKDGATLKFNFTDRRTAPKLVLSQTPTFGGVKVDIAGVRPRWEKNAIIEWPEGTVWPEGFDIGSVFTLADNQPKWVTGIAVEGNSLILTSKPAGMMIIFR